MTFWQYAKFLALLPTSANPTLRGQHSNQYLDELADQLIMKIKSTTLTNLHYHFSYRVLARLHFGQLGKSSIVKNLIPWTGASLPESWSTISFCCHYMAGEDKG